MNRSEFLASILKSGLLLSVPTNFFAKGKRYDAVQIYTAYVAGFKYYHGVENIDTIAVNDAVDLVHEEDNPHDDNAMAIYWNGLKLGFLPMKDNELYCRLINAGVPVYCDVIGVNAEAAPWKMCKVGVYLLYPEHYLQTKPYQLKVEKEHVVKVISA